MRSLHAAWDRVEAFAFQIPQCPYLSNNKSSKISIFLLYIIQIKFSVFQSHHMK